MRKGYLSLNNIGEIKCMLEKDVKEEKEEEEEQEEEEEKR
jgi:hypothetical protein